MAEGPRSIRIGRATAFDNSPRNGELCSRFVGPWRSKAPLDYLHACITMVEAVGLAMAREKCMEIANLPGQVSRYAEIDEFFLSCDGPVRAHLRVSSVAAKGGHPIRDHMKQ